MTNYKAWLPASHLQQSELVDPIREMFAEWVRTWLGDRNPICSKNWQPVSSCDEKFGGELLLMEKSPALDRHGLWIAAYDRRAIAEQMLDVDIEKAVLRAVDGEFLDRLADTAISDLRDRIEGLSADRSIGAGSEYSRWQIKLAIGATPLFILECAEEWLIDIAKQLSPASRNPAPLRSREAALAGQKICVGASIAHMRITVDELENLGSGDVLLFDKLATEPVMLMVEGVRNDLAACDLVEQEGMFMLKQYEGEPSVGRT